MNPIDSSQFPSPPFPPCLCLLAFSLDSSSPFRMYPFNRTTSLHAENAEPTVEELEEEEQEHEKIAHSNGKIYKNLSIQVSTSENLKGVGFRP